MNYSTFSAKCPFEIGDRIINDGTNKIHTITDIACIHYVKHGKVEFRYELNGNGEYIKLQITIE